MKKNAVLFVIVSVACAAVSGCATVRPGPGHAKDAVTAAMDAIRTGEAGDARYQRVEGREFLAFDTDLKSRLEKYPASGTAPEKREFLADLVARAKALADAETELELKRVPPGEADVTVEDYAAAASARYEEERARIGALETAKDADGYLARLRADTRPSIKVSRGRTWKQVLTLPFSPFVRLWMGYHILSTPTGEKPAAYYRVEVYRPDAAPSAKNPEQMTDDELMAHYAPVVAIEAKANVSYDRKADVFGQVRMEGKDARNAEPRIDTAHPVVYAYAETKEVQGRPVKFLVYTLWFPERPKLKGGFDPEVGPTQGSIVRVALDASNRPLIYENVSSCGCYYKVFPSERLESAAKAQYGTPLAGKRFAVENKVKGGMDANVPVLVPDSRERLTAVYAAGTHEVTDIRTDPAARVQSERAYELRPYDDLESLPFRGGSISMFDQDGLVRSADRLEAALLAPSGMYHAGTPRQRGTLMIYFDQADFDDPHLLERYLRLPQRAFDPS